MVKIGILTYHRSLNYGAVMQAVALSSEIKKRFPEVDVEIVDYMSRRMDCYYKMITVYRGPEGVTHLFDRIQMYRAFQRNVKSLPLSKRRIVSDNCKKVESWLVDKYDILIVGSDAVWNYKTRGLPNPYFMSHVGKCHRFSYAASCNGLGLSAFSDIPKNDWIFLQQAFEQFDYIGVRDLQTEQLVHEVCPTATVTHNCDPSLLLGDLSGLDRTKLVQKLVKKCRFNPEKPTIAFMMSNLNGDFRRELAMRIKNKYGDFYQTVSLYSYNKYADIPYISDLTPREWSVIFGLFKLTISKYFHGTMFSLLNHTPVLAVGAEKSTGSFPNKIVDALERMKLSDYYFSADKNEEVNWDLLMEKLDEMLHINQTERIVNGLCMERTSAESFFNQLEQTIATIG